MSITTPDPRRWCALALLCAAQFIVILDTSIIGIALPAIQSSLGFSAEGLSWIFNAYVIIFGGLLLLGGRLSDLFGARRLFMLGFAILTAGSLVAGLAASQEVLLAGRAVQGLGAALIAPSAMTILVGLFPHNGAELGKAFAADIALLKQSGVNPVVVHGGGPQIGAMLTKMGIESKFEGGLRVTDQKTVEIVEMVLAGSINKEIVALINQTGEWAIGLCGKDGNMVFAEKAKKTVVDPDSNIERVLDLGFVGEVVEVDRTLLDLLAKSEMIPVIAPVAPGRDGATYNINADTFAGAIAGALRADRLLFLTDVPGVLDKDKNLIKELSVAQAQALIKDGTISGGMIPKVETCIEAIKAGVQGVVILNGKTSHSVLLEIFTEGGAGTLIVP